jgi:hypothetical protein
MRPRNSNIKGANLAHMAVQLSALALALGCPTASAQSIAQGTFIADRNTGCKVWNPNPKSVETIVWSGSCVNGFAHDHGKLQWLQNDKIYETDDGDWSAGRQVGHGSQAWPLGRYDGEIVNSEPNGQGVLTLKTARYDGEFRNGKPNGFGTITSQHGVFKGTWKEGCLIGGKQKIAVGVLLSTCP